MGDYLPFIVIGLTTGSVYAMAAIGLVLTYKTSRIFNFAHGSLATVAVLIFFALVNRFGMDWRLAALITVAGVGPLLGVGFEHLGRRLTPLTTEAKVLTTIGLVLLITGGVTLWGAKAYGDRRAPPPHLPGQLVRILGVNVGVDQMIIVAVGLVMTVLLYLVLDRTRAGLSMRAVVDNPDLLAYTGRSPMQAQRLGWALGIGFVALSGLLLTLSPSNGVPVEELDLLVLAAFGGAAIGGFSSLPWTYVGGLVIGIAGALSTKFVAQVAWLGGLPPSIPFLVLFVVLVAFPRHLAPERASQPVPYRPRQIQVARFWRWPLGIIILGALLIVPLSKNVHLVYSSNLGLAYAIIFLGLSLLIRTSGQVSLCQIALAALGAATFAHVMTGLGAPWPASVVLGGLAAGAVGAVVAIPAIRVGGIYLALATFGFGVLVEQLLYPTHFMFLDTGTQSIPRPVIGPFNFDDDVTFFFLALAIFGLALLLVLGIRRARLGRLLRALSDSPVALATQGTSINITRVAVFSISAFLAGVGGALIVAQDRFLVDSPFASINSLVMVAVLLTLRVGEPVSSLLAAGAFVVVPSFLNGNLQVWWLDIGFGLGAIVAALIGTATWLPRWRWAPRRGAAPADRVPGHESGPEPPARPPGRPEASAPEAAGLEIRDLSVRFKGVVAVEHLDLLAPGGQITGLIGPNGAGKTTTFDFCSGLVEPVSGRLLLNGRDLSSMSPAARARHGLGRTFQRINLFDSLTVRENVELGCEGALAGAHLVTHVVAPPRQARLTAEAAQAALDLVGISALAGRDVRSLSTSEKRLVELARCLAGNFDFLLLDEPSSGLDVAETIHFGATLTRVVDEREVGVLLVEHNMALVQDVCSYLYVLEFGRLIFAGEPAAAVQSRAVRTAYLGVEASAST
jgi:ABC-type branched-subunit amino acid transport system ATPase component/branched-subunit amino acid ABC-type transport system permease component